MSKKSLEITLSSDTVRTLEAYIQLTGSNLNQWIATAIYEKLKKEGVYTYDPVKPWGLSK
jgi:hypothetical protein